MLARLLRVLVVLLVVTAVASSKASAQIPTLIAFWPTNDLPLGILDDGSGNLYVPDQYNGNGFAKYTTAGTFESYLAGTSGPIEGYGVGKLSNGDIVSDSYYGNLVTEYSPTGAIVRQWPTGGIRSGYLTIAPNDDIYITDDQAFVVRHFSSTGAPLGTWSGPTNPTGIAYSQGIIYVVGYFNGFVTEYTPTGTPLGAFPSGLQRPEQLVADASGKLYVAAFGDQELKCYEPTTGSTVWTLGPNVPGYGYGPSRFAGIEVAADGTLYAGDYDHKQILVFSMTPTPTLRTSFGAVKARYR
jgi:hypothetical protein